MEPQAAETSLLRALEEELLRPEVRRSPDRVGRLLSQDFVEFGRSGRTYDKGQIIAALQQEAPDPAVQILLTDFSARELAPGVVLTTYRTVRRSGAAEPDLFGLRSSIWKLIDGRWQMVFHQGTPASGAWSDPSR